MRAGEMLAITADQEMAAALVVLGIESPEDLVAQARQYRAIEIADQGRDLVWPAMNAVGRAGGRGAA